MKLHAAHLVLAAVLAASSSASSLPGVLDECKADTNCSICVDDALNDLFSSGSKSPKCQYVEEGKWDESIQACIDDDCSSTGEGCIKGLQELINDTSVVVSIVEQKVICNKAGGNEAVDVDDDGDRCREIVPPSSTNGGIYATSVTDTSSGKVFDFNCVDGETQSLITAVCLSEEYCSEYGVPYEKFVSPVNKPTYSDDDAVDDDSLNYKLVDVDGGRCKVVDPPQSANYMSWSDGIKFFDSNCVDRETQSLITAICLSEEDCSEYGVPSKYDPNQVFDKPTYSDDEEFDDEDDDSSSSKTRTGCIGRGMLTIAAVVYAWNM